MEKDLEYYKKHLKFDRDTQNGLIKEGVVSKLKIPGSSLGPYYKNQAYEYLYNTAYFLLEENAISPFCSVHCDETWHYCAGDPIEVFYFSKNGDLNRVVVGPNLHENQVLYHIVPKNLWQAAKVTNGQYGFSLISHFDMPAFSMLHREKGTEEKLLKLFPRQHKIIKELAWKEDTIDSDGKLNKHEHIYI